MKWGLKDRPKIPSTQKSIVEVLHLVRFLGPLKKLSLSMDFLKSKT